MRKKYSHYWLKHVDDNSVSAMVSSDQRRAQSSSKVELYVLTQKWRRASSLKKHFQKDSDWKRHGNHALWCVIRNIWNRRNTWCYCFVIGRLSSWMTTNSGKLRRTVLNRQVFGSTPLKFCKSRIYSANYIYEILSRFRNMLQRTGV